MPEVLLALCLLAQPGGDDAARSAQPAAEYLRGQYLRDAEKYAFQLGHEQALALELVKKPVMAWATDDDWSGDVFVWTAEGCPAVIGCILSGPSGANRSVYHEFHLLSSEPITAVDLQTRRHWQPKEGLKRMVVEGAPKPADSSAARLTQMRQLARAFTVRMEADGPWELRLLTQPLLRYGDAGGQVIDGGLFAYVWPKGTDPEMILLLECRRTDEGLIWHYAPVRFTTRPIWLSLGEREVWRVETHHEPRGEGNTGMYTTDFARTIPPADAGRIEKKSEQPETSAP
jgi:hypothetical protein